MGIEELVFRGSVKPPPERGGVPALPNFGVPFYLCVRLLLQNYQICRGNTRGGGACILGSDTFHIPRERNFSAPQFLGFSCIYAFDTVKL